MVPFGGWDMPVEYSGITAEHMAVRTAAGLFDVSHMGEVEIAGKGALEAVQHITTNDASKLQVGQIQYSGLTTPDGTFVDDLLVYRFGPSHFLLVINAGNIDKDYAWIAARAKEAVPDIAIVNSSDRYALIAVQGPKAQEILQTLTAIDLPAIKYYWFAHGEIAGVRGTVSRTGYTGEDGFEVMVPPAMAARVWDALLQAGKPHGLIPAGLGARDTLRLEAAMRLYGNDIDDTTTVIEADLGWIVGWNKPEFLGRDVLHAAEGERRAEDDRRLRDDRSRHRAARPSGVPQRRAGRRRHQRHADAVSEEGDRHGLRAAGAESARHRARDRHPRPQGEGGRRANAVLQATEEVSPSPKPQVPGPL